MIPCPKCGNHDYREARQCPQMGGKPVCIRCCTECVYYDFGGFYPCRFNIENPKIDYASEINKLSRAITHKRKQAEHFYEGNKPWIAEKIETDIRGLQRRLVEMRGKYERES